MVNNHETDNHQVDQLDNDIQQEIIELRQTVDAWNEEDILQEQQENIGQIVNEIYRLREELAKLKLTLKQGLVLIDEPCAKHAIVLDGLQSFAGSQLGANQRVQGTLNRLSEQLTVVQQRTIELQKNTSLDWRIQALEDDLATVQKTMQGGGGREIPERTITQLTQQMQELQQNPLWHDMQVAAEEVHQIEERSFP